MNKDEMIKNDRRKIMDLLYKLKRGELCTPNCYGCCGDNELDFAYCPDVTDNFEKELANLGYRQIADDEIVIKKRQYEQLKKYNRDRKRLRLKWQQAKQDLDDIYSNGFVLLVEHHEIVDQVARETRQETARKIFEDIEFYSVRSLNDEIWGNHFKLTDCTMLDLKMKYGIDKEIVYKYRINLGEEK